MKRYDIHAKKSAQILTTPSSIMDNARFHRKAKLRGLAEKAGVGLIFLPPYSPDLNPIEKSWANMKRWLRDNLSSFHSVEPAIYEYFSVADL